MHFFSFSHIEVVTAAWASQLGTEKWSCLTPWMLFNFGEHLAYQKKKYNIEKIQEIFIYKKYWYIMICFSFPYHFVDLWLSFGEIFWWPAPRPFYNLYISDSATKQRHQRWRSSIALSNLWGSAKRHKRGENTPHRSFSALKSLAIGIPMYNEISWENSPRKIWVKIMERDNLKRGWIPFKPYQTLFKKPIVKSKQPIKVWGTIVKLGNTLQSSNMHISWNVFREPFYSFNCLPTSFSADV